jgi:hypothetical protein
MLEHCIPADHADALAGDLLEDFRAGRSDGWYWRQALSACAVSWAEGLRARMPLLLFTLIWSMLATAWKALIGPYDNFATLDRIVQYIGPLGVFAALAGWVVIHSAFLWAGILVYYIANASLGKAPRGGKLTRALLLAPVVFVPLYGATFVWCKLYWYSFFANATPATTPLGQIADFQILTDVMRLPFFITMLAALWNLVPQPARTAQSFLAKSHSLAFSVQSGPLRLTPWALNRFLVFVVSAGLINAMIAAFVMCRLPAAHSPTLESLFLRATVDVVIGAVAGVIGAYLYWHSPASPFRTEAPLPFSLFALVCAAGWVWVPAMGMFSEQLSGANAVVAAIGAFFLGIGLRQSTFSFFSPAPKLNPDPTYGSFDIFEESLYRPRGEAHGYLIAVGLFAALTALAFRENLIAAALLATTTFLFAWKWTFVSSAQHIPLYRRSALRLVLVAVPAILITVWALLDGVSHRNRAEAVAALAAAQATAAEQDSANEPQSKSSKAGTGGYESLILWPFPEKKQIVPPIPAHTSFLAPGTTEPLIIRFDGAYWYLQPPDERPGPTAHQAHGTPLGAEIRSINDLPLVMDAHQPLGSSIPIARCREIEVEIENHDDRPGSIAMAVLLSDTSAPGKPELYLGQQPIVPAELDRNSLDSALAVSPAPAMNDGHSLQTLRFPIPSAARIRNFNEITVMILPDAPNSLVGPKIAVRQFQLLPR